MEEATTRMTVDEAADRQDGYLVLNGAADGPATRVLQDGQGADVRAKTQCDAEQALVRAGYAYPRVELIDHEFPDAVTGQPHAMKVWVPGYGT